MPNPGVGRQRFPDPDCLASGIAFMTGNCFAALPRETSCGAAINGSRRLCVPLSLAVWVECRRQSW